MNSFKNITIRNALKNDIPLIHSLAHKIWPNAYKEILSPAQLQYMMELIYSEASLHKQFDTGHHFLIAEENKTPVAFASYNMLKPGIYKLQKIYALPQEQGKGIGKLLINYIIDEIKADGATSLLLNVNRHNKAKQVYEHLGFKVISEEDIDIGEGYFMNDYIMEKKLEP
jgi:GNAT superfamily N-acetyltransferase